MECPKCKSDNTQRLEVVYDEGTHHTRSTTVGGGYGRGAAIGTATTTGKTQSKQAAKAAPPGKPSWIPIAFLAFLSIIAILNAWYIVGLGMSGLTIFLGKKIAEAKKTYPGLYQTWLNSWMCNKCGEIYVVNN